MATPKLPARRAFVVQLSTEADVARQHYVGRAEHVSSGQVAHFETLAELLKFFVEVLESEATGA